MAASAGQKRHREDDGSGLSLDGAANGIREHTLWVGSLDSKTTEYQLSRLFKPYGPLARLDILYHKAGPQRGQPRGYGFVELPSRENAGKAREALDGFKLNGRSMIVRFVSDRILYDGGLPGGAGGARAGGDVREGREYRTDAEREEDRRAALVRASSKGVASTQVLAATLDAKLAAIRARLGGGGGGGGGLGGAGRGEPEAARAGSSSVAVSGAVVAVVAAAPATAATGSLSAKESALAVAQVHPLQAAVVGGGLPLADSETCAAGAVPFIASVRVSSSSSAGSGGDRDGARASLSGGLGRQAQSPRPATEAA